MQQLFTIYVIELADAARLGPKPDPTKPYLYVGVTALLPEKRFEKHKEGGITASRIVTRHGVRLRPDLSAKFKRSRSRDVAAEREQAAAAALRKRGYVVYSGRKGYFWDRYRQDP